MAKKYLKVNGKYFNGFIWNPEKQINVPHLVENKKDAQHKGTIGPIVIGMIKQSDPKALIEVEEENE